MHTVDHYRRMAMNSSVGMLRLSHDWELIEANASMLEMLEIDNFEQLRGLSINDIVAPECRELIQRERAKRYSGIASTYELVLLGRRGRRSQVVVSAMPMMDGGAFGGVIATFADVTNLRSAELALHDTMDRYRAVVTALGEGIAVISRSGEVLELNPSGRQILGAPELSFDSFLPMPAGWRMSDEQGRQLRGEELPIGITLTTGKACRNVLLQMERPDGQSIWLSVNTQPLTRLDDPQPYACVATFHDVSSLKRAHDELKQREQRLSRFLDAVPDLLFILSSDGILLDYRDTGRIDLEPGEFLGKHFSAILPTEQAEAMQQLLDRTLLSGCTEVSEVTVEVEAETMSFQAQATRLDKESVIVLVRDVTEMRRSEQRLRQHEQERAHLGRLGALGEMVAGISHEINQPLHAIANFAAASLNKLDSSDAGAKEQVQQWLQRIASQAFRASQIVKRFRQFSSPVARTSTISLAELLQETVELVSGEVHRRKAQLEVRNLASDATIVVDRIQLQQVLVNFLVNACEAVENNEAKDRRIVLLAKVEHGMLVCEVADNGVGLPEVPMSQIFDAFFTTKSNGLGLGLAISRTIIESLGGRIWARPNFPRGAVFAFEIPHPPQKDEE
jgi:two-component system, LuxR family, sensor kinase FixL